MDETTQGYVDSDYLTRARELFLPIKEKSFALMGSLESRQVLDVGCGPGLDTLAMAQQVGPEGCVLGVDIDGEMLVKARQLSGREHMTARVMYLCARADQLPFGNQCFDAVRSERLFMHLPEPEQVLAEKVRITRPGGRLVVVDTDWGSLSTQVGADGLERKWSRFLAASYLPNGFSGRRLYGQFNALGLQQVAVESMVFHTTDCRLWQILTQEPKVTAAALQNGYFDSQEADAWSAALKQSAQDQQFFASVTIMLVSAVVP